jgi:hypothetical protein
MWRTIMPECGNNKDVQELIVCLLKQIRCLIIQHSARLEADSLQHDACIQKGLETLGQPRNE